MSCTGSQPPTPEPPSAEPPPTHAAEQPAGSQGDTPSASHLQVNAGQAVPIQLTFTTVGPLHQGFFGRASSVRKLGEALGRCTDHTVEVQVVWSQQDLEGRIVGQLPRGTSVCAPVRAGDRIDLAPLVGATTALAAYRDEVAGMSDFRIANFVVAADLLGQGAFCRVKAAGQHPPDGTRFHPCVHVNGEPICAQGDPDKGVTTLEFADPADARRVAACL